MVDDFTVVYTDGAVDYPGASVLGWHADDFVFNGKPIDASTRITSLWMLSDFTLENGGTWVIPRSHKLKLEGKVLAWTEEQRNSFHPDTCPSLASAGDVLIFDCRLDHTAGPNLSARLRASPFRRGLVLRAVPQEPLRRERPRWGAGGRSADGDAGGRAAALQDVDINGIDMNAGCHLSCVLSKEERSPARVSHLFA
jgi:hypothetical protein